MAKNLILTAHQVSILKHGILQSSLFNQAHSTIIAQELLKGTVQLNPGDSESRASAIIDASVASVIST
jgi:hypothetical protein